MDLTLIQNVTSNATNTISSVTTSPVPVEQLSTPDIPERDLNISGLIFLIIPTVTILGNFLVIVAVLRFKSLQSAINFLILGLAVADLLVGLFVMPYAVYVHVQGGYWFLGSLMCDIYSASDVACSTASIFLLTVISFDRYRAVTNPINYSHTKYDTRRVVLIMFVIWFISLAIASPIVLGVNIRPPDADPYECRFYNPIFSISSSFISFVIPCFIVLFVYIRIMLALRQRRKIAKARRNSQSHSQPLRSVAKETTYVTRNSENNLQKVVTGIGTMDTITVVAAKLTTDSNTERSNLRSQREKELKKSSSPGALSRIIKLSPGKTLRQLSELKNSKIMAQKRLQSYDGYGMFANRNVNEDAETTKNDNTEISETEQFSSEGLNTAKNSLSEDFSAHLLESLSCSSSPCPCKQAILSRLLQDGLKGAENSTIFVPQSEVYKICQLRKGIIIGNKQNANLLDNGASVSDNAAGDFDSEIGLEGEIKKENIRAPHLFTNVTTTEYGKPAIKQGNKQEQLNFENEFGGKKLTDNELSLAENNKSADNKKHEQHEEYEIGARLQRPETTDVEKVANDSEELRKDFIKGSDSTSFRRKCGSDMKLLSLGSRNSDRNGFAAERKVQMFKKWSCRDSSSARKRANKSQRMEKRATKTLGVVVGIFLACWVPFFSVYILSAVCIQLDIESCQVGFYVFFYTTWLGYINSCVNPIIYTIFNIEFRRAFKCLLCGKSR